MRRNILIYLPFILLLLANPFFAQDFSIKSLRVYSSIDELVFPLIDIQDETKNSITIEFDVDGRYEPNLNIVFKYCDSEWQPYDNNFLKNPGYNTAYNLWFERLPLNARGASYNYKGKFPNQAVNFPFSGKWKFFIVDSQNEEKIFGEGKFFVVNPEVGLNVTLTRSRQEGLSPDIVSLGRTFDLRTSLILPDSLFNTNLRKIEIFENRKFAYPIVINRFDNTSHKFFEWNGSNRFTFIARSIRPGNEYRRADIRDVGRFVYPNTNAQFDGIETSNMFKKLNRDWNGATLLMNYKNDNAEYLNVNFRIRPPENITSPVFLVGSFNNWIVSPKYEMFDDNGLLNLTIELKRGVYEYQYVTVDFVNGNIENIDWNILEGNFWETDNEYHIFLFYESTDFGGYDKIIGYKRIKSGDL